MTTVNLHEARTHLCKLFARMVASEKTILAKAGKPVAKLSPIANPPKRRVPGNDAGKVVIKPDFDSPLPEFEL